MTSQCSAQERSLDAFISFHFFFFMLHQQRYFIFAGMSLLRLQDCDWYCRMEKRRARFVDKIFNSSASKNFKHDLNGNITSNYSLQQLAHSRKPCYNRVAEPIGFFPISARGDDQHVMSFLNHDSKIVLRNFPHSILSVTQNMNIPMLNDQLNANR